MSRPYSSDKPLDVAPHRGTGSCARGAGVYGAPRRTWARSDAQKARAGWLRSHQTGRSRDAPCPAMRIRPVRERGASCPLPPWSARSRPSRVRVRPRARPHSQEQPARKRGKMPCASPEPFMLAAPGQSESGGRRKMLGNRTGDRRAFMEVIARRLASDLHEIAMDAKRSEEHTSELQSLMRISYAGFCLKKKNKDQQH